MYVVRHHLSIGAEQQPGLLAEVETAHAGLESAPGFRWAMVLRSVDEPVRMAAVAMWLNRDDAGKVDFAVTHYDVATARGTMTPASFAALVDWRVEAGAAPGFVNRWNNAYHAIEDSMGSRLLQNMDDPAHYTGYHVATRDSALRPEILGAAIRDDAGGELRPESVERFEVVSLVEA
jgi:heme-degrading monooxygenase HmoA